MTPSGTAAHVHVSETNGGNPTKNVLDLVHATVERIDDMAHLRAALVDEKIKRMEREWIHLEAMATIREQHAKESRESEAKRLDAIRENDRLVVAAAAAQQQASITALATAATTTADTLRLNTERTVSPIVDRLTSIETTVNRGIGRSAVADPQLSELMAEMRKLSTSRDVSSGKSEGISQGWAILVGAIMLALAIYGGVFKSTAAVSAPPQVIYVPAPAGALLPTTPPQATPR